MAKFKKIPFKPWETKTTDGIEKRYYRMGATFMAAEPVRLLSSSAFKIYSYMKIESGGKKQFTFSNIKYKSFMSKPTFYKAVKELETKGFIDIVQRNKNLRKANVYAFSDRWKAI